MEVTETFDQKRRKQEEAEDLEAAHLDDETIQQEEDELDEFLEQALLHMNGQKQMRDFINQRTEEARASSSNVHAERCFAFVMDYAQNLDLPHFGGEQPGVTYYYSPLNVYIFGIVDLGLQPEQLEAYCYTEGKAKKGAANVASMMDHFVQRKMVRYDSEQKPMMAKRLSIACDNCGGQNKNNTVIRMAAYYVECGYFEEVEVLFFVRGHTKNACDRLFNSMKKGFHKKDIFTFNHPVEPENLMVTLDKHEQVTVLEATSDIFRNWDEKMEALYPKVSEINANHVFRVKKSQPDSGIRMEKQEYADSVTDYQGLASRNSSPGLGTEKRDQLLRRKPAELVAPGLAMMKRVDLCDKYWTLVPDHIQPFFCEPVTQDERENVRKERNEKAAQRRKNKRKTAPRTSSTR